MCFDGWKGCLEFQWRVAVEFVNDSDKLVGRNVEVCVHGGVDGTFMKHFNGSLPRRKRKSKKKRPK